MKKEITSTGTTFKAVVYWKYKKGGNMLYTQQEIAAKENRRYLWSYDYFQTDNGRNITDHNQALLKLYGTLRKHNRFYTAIVFWNSLKGEIILSKWSEGNMICAPRTIDFRKGGKFGDEIFINGVGGNEIKSNTTGSVQFPHANERIDYNKGKTFQEMENEFLEDLRKRDQEAHAAKLIEFQQMYGGQLPKKK